MQTTKWELYEYQKSRSVIDLGPNHLHSIFLNFFSSITADFNTSSAIRWAIQDQWSSVFFLHEMLSMCIDSGYLVGTTPHTVFFWLFWNFADVLCMEWRCACDLGVILWLFFSLFLLCELNLFFWHEMLSKCMDSGYRVGTTPLTVFLQLFWNFADVFSMEWSCACGFGIIYDIFFLSISSIFRY